MSIIAVLTEDLLVRLNQKLESETDRKTWRLVCKEFHRIDTITRSKLRVLRMEFLQGLLMKFSRIESLDLSVCPRIDDATVSLLLSGNPVSSNPTSLFPRIGGHSSLTSCNSTLQWTQGLRKLVLSRTAGLRYTGLEQLVRACPSLESTDVSYCCDFGDREAAAISAAAGLRELRMDKCLELTDMGLVKIAVGCTKLEKLSLKWCLEIGDLSIDLLCKKCSDLKFLDLSYLKVTNDSLQSVASLPKLEVLTLMGCYLLDDVGLEFLEFGCPLLRVIDVSRCDGIGSSGLISVVRGHNSLEQLNASHCLAECSSTFLHFLKDLKNLKTIRLDGARVSDSCLRTFSLNCKNLLEVGLSKCTGVTNIGIMQLVCGCVNLKTLDLTCCQSITDAAIISISDSCRNLTCLKLESCNMITEKSLYYLGSFCLLLEELDLTDCSGINDTGLERLSRCSELTCLKLALCTNITDKGLCYIASNCSKISELDLYRCDGIGDNGLAALPSGCKKLKVLNLSYCTNVTDKGMHYISQLEELADLEMRRLPKITSNGLSSLASGCKRLADLDIKLCENIDDSGFWALAYYSRNLRQINMSYCNVSNVGLCMVLGNLRRLQDIKLVHLKKVTIEGFELALRACCGRIKKVKLVSSLRFKLSREITDTLQSGGCKITWD